MQATPSLILTLGLEEKAQQYFTALRNSYYPKYCNYLQAHITLFHRLPAGLEEMQQAMQQFTNRNNLQLEVTGISNIGNGVVFNLSSDELQALHKSMQYYFNPWLISNDRKILVPHITIQNKVTAFKAAQTKQLLLPHFKPFIITGNGIAVWQYLKGPWQLLQFYPFHSVGQQL
jgi:2'-5' RNA ligase